MENLFIFLISFVVIFSFFLIDYMFKKNKQQVSNEKAIQLLISKYHLNSKKLNYAGLSLIISLIHSIIIAGVGTFVSSVSLEKIWQLSLGFVILMSLLYFSYMLIGIYLKRKEKHNGKH